MCSPVRTVKNFKLHTVVRCVVTPCSVVHRLLRNVLPRFVGRDSSVGITILYGAGRSGDQIPVGARFSAPVQTGPGAHPASCAVGLYRVFFPGLKRTGYGVDHPPHLSSEVKERVGLYFYSLSGFSWPIVG